MEALNFESGLKEFAINNDPNKVLRFNPSDIAVLQRIQKCMETIKAEFDLNKNVFENMQNEDQTEQEILKCAQTIESLNEKVRETIDEALGTRTSQMVFEDQNVFAVANGHFIWENFLNAVIKLCTDSLEHERAEAHKKVAKYTKKYEQK